MTSADVGGAASAGAALVGVPLIGAVWVVTEAAEDVAGLEDGMAGALTLTAGGVELRFPRVLGWLTAAEQPANDTAPSSTRRLVPRRYPTGGGYGRYRRQPALSTG